MTYRADLIQLCSVLGWVLVSCTGRQADPVRPDPEGAPSTFARIYAEAEAGVAESQNALGFMLFFGEAAPHSRIEARRWFTAAADQGYVPARLNLALMYYLGAGVDVDRPLAETHFRNAEALAPGFSTGLQFRTLPELAALSCAPPQNTEPDGQAVYTTFCAGCHGVNGLASYGGAPSFAFGERLTERDAELFTTITGGHDVMPGWDDKLPRYTLTEALRFVRTLPREYRSGILHRRRQPGELRLRFGPMAVDSGALYYEGIFEHEENLEPLAVLCDRAGVPD